MRIFVDENEPPAIVPPLRIVLGDVEFSTSGDECLSGTDDLALFEIIASRGFDAIITQDRNQQKNKDERARLRNTGLHWIGRKQHKISGRAGIAATVASYLAAIPLIVAEVRKDLPPPSAFLVRNIELEPNKRFTRSEL